MKTKEDVIEALRKVHFLERTAELSQKFKRDYSADVKTARKDKVFAIISKLGYTPKFDYDIFRMKEIDDDEKQVIQFWFERPWVKFAFHYYDNGEVVLGGGPWTSLKKAVAASDDYLSGAPAYRNYEELEEIITTAVAIYMDSKAALFSDKQDIVPPTPDIEKTYHLNTTKREVKDALNRMKFVERDTKIAQIFHKDARTTMPPIDKKKVFAIIEKLGFVPGHEHDFYYIKNQEIGPYTFTMNFRLKYAAVDLTWYVSEEGESIYGGPWSKIKRELTGDNLISVASPRFPNYDSLERIMANVLQMLEDFKYEFCKSKGIQYDRKNVVALEKEYIATEVRDIRPLV